MSLLFHVPNTNKDNYRILEKEGEERIDDFSRKSQPLKSSEANAHNFQKKREGD